ncbi:MAG TPA: hypothetical protein VK545_26550 [Streptomyces sp.]|nr:hypothetical protein [Streptomyces sp.]
MGGKAWCCGGSTGSGGGLTSITTADSPTVDLEGDGSAGAPLTATVKVHPFEPNGLTADAMGLVVRPSGDAGNALGIGSDGNLFVPTPTDTTTLVPVTGGAPAPVDPNGARSVDIDVAETGPDQWSIGARLSPVWGQSALSGVSPGTTGAWVLGAQLAVPENGVYLVEAFVDATANVFYSRASADYYINGGLFVNDAQIKTGAAVVNSWSFPSGTTVTLAASGTVTLTQRLQLTAGQLVQAKVAGSGTYFTGDGFGALASVAFNKISD